MSEVQPLQSQMPLGSLQAQQIDVESGAKSDLLAALAHVPHTGVYGLQVHASAPIQYQAHAPEAQ